MNSMATQHTTLHTPTMSTPTMSTILPIMPTYRCTASATSALCSLQQWQTMGQRLAGCDSISTVFTSDPLHRWVGVHWHSAHRSQRATICFDRHVVIQGLLVDFSVDDKITVTITSPAPVAVLEIISQVLEQSFDWQCVHI